MKTKLLLAVVTASVLLLRAVVAQSPPATMMMKAAVMHQYGGPEVLKYEETPRPAPAENEVLVRVIAAAVNPVDTYIRAGRMAHRDLSSGPMILGYDIAGIVEKVGPKVTRFKPGDEAYAYLSVMRGGGYAEYAIAQENEISPKPRNIDFTKAAAVPLAATTAWQALIETAKLTSGQTVLIHGGSGGVGSFAVQIARAPGAKVIATASSANQDLLKQLGVDQPIDYTTTQFQNVVKDVHVVLNCVRADTLPASYGVVKKGGIIVSITGPPDPDECARHGIRGEGVMAHPDAQVLAELTKLIEANKIKPIVSQTFALKDVAQAHRQIETHHTRGKIVLEVAPAGK